MNANNLKTWCSVNLDAIAHNYNYIKSRTNSRVISIVKANAYGHGAVPVSSRLEKEGCDFFAVSSIEEALELRRGGIDSSILVLGYILPSMLQTTIENNISFAISSVNALSEVINLKSKTKAKIHIKLDTGMNRTGFNAKENVIDPQLEEAIQIIKKSDCFILEGVFSHLAKADSDKDFSYTQYNRYLFNLEYIKSNNLSPQILHICNSEGAYGFEEFHLGAIRAGIHIYGIADNDNNFLPAMNFYTRVVDVHTVKAGQGVSYSHSFIADKDMKIAIIGAGYADGFFRCLSQKKGQVLINGKLCYVVGKVCMDMTMVDVSELCDVNVGDIVTLWGDGIPCSVQAKNANTIPYELICSVSPRVTRVYD